MSCTKWPPEKDLGSNDLSFSNPDFFGLRKQDMGGEKKLDRGTAMSLQEEVREKCKYSLAFHTEFAWGTFVSYKSLKMPTKISG